MNGSPTDTCKGPVDLAQPVLAQLGALGADYDAWVHEAIPPARMGKISADLVSAGESDPSPEAQATARIARRWPRSLRLFRSPFLESLTHLSWWVIPLIWVPVATALFLLAWLRLDLPLLQTVAWTAGGVLLWTLTEYALHRFLFHYKPRSTWGRKIHFLAHGIHHMDPWDPSRLVFPPVPAALIAAALFGILLLFMPLPQGLACMAGMLAGYIVYDMTHYFTHHVKPRSRWGRFLKVYHLEHHHRHWERMFGVSQPLWDIVFRTGRPKT